MDFEGSQEFLLRLQYFRCTHFWQWNGFVFELGVILFRIFLYSVRMRENANQNNSQYGNFLRKESLQIYINISISDFL